jgi:hypothetical protein
MSCRKIAYQLSLGLCLLLALSSCGPPPDRPLPPARENQPQADTASSNTTDRAPVTNSTGLPLETLFADGIQVSTTETQIIVQTQAIPTDHQPGEFPACQDTNGDGRFDNPNEVVPQNLTFRLPRHPQLADRTTPLFPVVGIAFNGVPLYGPGTAEGEIAVLAEVFDGCNGHPDPTGVYHYHQHPNCAVGQQIIADHAPVIGIAFDGFGIYDFSTNGPALDECNGHQHDLDGDGDIDDQDYHYHMTDNPEAPILGCFKGTPERNDTGRGEFVGNQCRP